MRYRRLAISYTMNRQSLDVSDSDRRLLMSWARAGTTPQRVVTRANIVLLAAQGEAVRAIAELLGVNPRTVVLWRRRYATEGPGTLWRDAPGRGRKRTIASDAAPHLRSLLKSAPPNGGRWSVRRLAQITGLSRSSVHRLLAASESSPAERRRRRHVGGASVPLL
jgi:transposase